MEDVIVEIPEQTEDMPWEPPVLRTETYEEGEKKPEKEHLQSAADVFFMQYVICILVLTLVLVVRLYDEAVFRNVADTFRARTHAPSEPWAESLLSLVRNLWS